MRLASLRVVNRLLAWVEITWSVRSTDAGRTFPGEDVDGIKDFIHQEMVARGSIRDSRAAALARFDVRRITEELAGHMDRVATTKTANAPAANARHS